MSEAQVPAAPLAHAAEVHQRLVERARCADRDNVDAMMCLLTAVVVHGLFERALLDAVDYVPRELQEGIEREHASFLESLALMEELAAGGPASDDLGTLCRATHDRVLRHVERDERVIYGSLARLDAFSAQKQQE